MITLNDDDELFIALCKLDEVINPHSFILIGAHKKSEDKNYILCSVGKLASSGPTLILVPFYFLFGNQHRAQIPAHLKRENFFGGLHGNLFSFPFHYEAFHISLTQYRNFLSLLRSSHFGKRILRAYIPLARKNENGSTNYDLRDIPENSELESDDKIAAFNQSVATVSHHNSCRHTSLMMLNETLGREYSGKGISQSYLQSPPAAARIDDNQLRDKLFIFPLPPNRKTQSPEIFQILSRIYSQLEKIPKLYGRSADTHKKFDKLKKLYMSLDTRVELTIDDLLLTVNDWAEENKALIDKHRSSYSFFRSTATRKMINDVIKTAEKAVRHP